MVQRSDQYKLKTSTGLVSNNTLASIVILIAMTACASLEERSVASAPGSSRDGQSAPIDSIQSDSQNVPDLALARPQIAPPKANAATSVTALLGTAQRLQDTGDFDAAVATLERAVRIDSRNALAWHQLASLRYQQKNWEQAAQLALKSNLFAGPDKALKARNWRLIADAKNLQGDSHAAESARQRASELEN